MTKSSTLGRTARFSKYAGVMSAAIGSMSLGCGVHDSRVDGFDQTAQAATVGPQVDPEKALLIRNTSVVNHYFRTTDPCKNVATPAGQTAPPANAARKWSFGYLMTQMANQSSTGVSAADFALAWLNEWERSQTINGDPVVTLGTGQSNPPVATLIKQQWLRRSGGTRLDLNFAPFRLLAIVNRFDVRTNTAFGAGNAGELRFIFGVLNLESRESTGQCASMGQTGAGPINGNFPSLTNVILEYAVDKTSSDEIKRYAQSWVTLNGFTQNSGDYRGALERITESVVRAGVGNIKSRANGSALNVLRVNESNDGGVWDFREFAINKTTKKLKAQTIAQTPIARLNGSEDLGMWAGFWGQAIFDETHNPPLTFQQDPSALSTSYTNTFFRGAHATSEQQPWSFNEDPEIQFRFSKNTCNGCHKTERLQTAEVFHVRGRPFTERATLSPFLLGKFPDGSPMFAVDPRDEVQVRHFSELERRRQHLGSYLSGTASSTAALELSSPVH